MIKYLQDRGWIYTGECGCGDGSKYYTNAKYQGWRLKVFNGQRVYFQQHQNQFNPLSYTNVQAANANDFEIKYNGLFKAITTNEEAKPSTIGGRTEERTQQS